MTKGLIRNVCTVGLFIAIEFCVTISSHTASRAQNNSSLNKNKGEVDASYLRKTCMEVDGDEGISACTKIIVDNPEDAAALMSRGVAYINRKAFKKAETDLKKTTSLFLKTQGPDHPYLAMPLYLTGRLYSEQRRYTEAEPLYKRSLTIREKELGPDHPYVATTLNDLAWLYFKQGRYADAEPLYKRSLAIREKALGPAYIDVAASLENLAFIYKLQHRHAEAEPLYKRSLTIKEKELGPDHPDVATSLNNLAALYSDAGRYADAEQLYQRSLAVFEKVLGPDHPTVATLLHNLARLYSHAGRYAHAELFLKRSLVIREKALGPDHIDVAASLNNLALLYDNQSRYTEAEPLYKRSLTIGEKLLGPNHPDVATSLHNLAQLYSKAGRDTEVEPLYKRSLVISEKALGPDHPDVAASLNNLALLYVKQSRYAEAEPLLKRSLAIREKTLGPNHPDVATSLNSLGGLYSHTGRDTEAEPLYKRSLVISEKALGPDHPDIATSLNNLALLYDKQSRYAEVEPLLKRSLAIREKALGPNHPDVSASLNNLAGSYLKQDRLGDALSIVKRTIASMQAKNWVSFGTLYQSQKANLINSKQSFAGSYSVLQYTMASAAADAISKLAQRFAAGSDELAAAVRQEQDLSAENGKIDSTLISAVSKAPQQRNAAAEEQMRKRLAEIKAERQLIQSALNLKFPEFVTLSKPQPLTLEETQKLLTSDEAVVAFSIGAYESYAWIITKTNATWTEIPVKANDLNEEIKTLRQSLTFEVDKPYDAELAYKIYQQIFGPLTGWLAGKTRLSIVPDGPLTSIPFELLITADPNGKKLRDVDWLVKSHSVTILPSIYSLKTMRTQARTSQAPKPIIAFADPVFSNAAQTLARAERSPASRSITDFYEGTEIDVRKLGEKLDQLPGTRREVRAVSEALGGIDSDLKFGLNATETAVKTTALDQYRVVYFATHGLVAGDLAKFSKAKAEPSLVLTIPEKPTARDDGLLQASEVAQLKLNADWVVLSACNTASSDGVGAEALSGLTRAFLYAGSRSLIVSHWEVNDDATSKLMTELFKASSSNPYLSHAEALQQAEITMINSAKNVDEAHPRLWAPFMVVGEPAKRLKP